MTPQFRHVQGVTFILAAIFIVILLLVYAGVIT